MEETQEDTIFGVPTILVKLAASFAVINLVTLFFVGLLMVALVKSTSNQAERNALTNIPVASPSAITIPTASPSATIVPTYQPVQNRTYTVPTARVRGGK